LTDYVFCAKNKNKSLWKLINKESGNSQLNCNIIINYGEKIITNPQTVSDRFNTFFAEVIEALLSQTTTTALTLNLPKTTIVAQPLLSSHILRPAHIYNCTQ
jgi:hypothetical protein